MPACHYHPERSGVGLCMRCRVVLCGPCRTRVQGVNQCHVCLEKLAGVHPGGRDAVNPLVLLEKTILVTLTAGFGSLVLFGLCWLAGGRLAP